MESLLLRECAVKGCENAGPHAFKDASSGRLFGMCQGCWAKIQVRIEQRNRGL